MWKVWCSLHRGRCPRGLIIRLIIQTIRRDPSGSDGIDEAPNVSSPDPSGADQSDAEHQATDLPLGLSHPSDGSSPKRARLDRDGWRCPAGPLVNTRRRFTVTVRTTRAVTSERRVLAQARLSWQTQELVAALNTPAPLWAV
jgi:hypothetical protein